MAERIAFRLVVPPGWETLPLDEGGDAAIRTLARRIASAQRPEQRRAVEDFVAAQLADAAAKARESGGFELLIPTQLVQGRVLPITIVIGSTPSLDGQEAQSSALLAYASRHDGAIASEVGGRLAIRSLQDVAAGDAERDASLAFATRRVAYVIAAPVPTKQLLLVTCSIQRFDYDTDGEILAAMELLADAIVGTIRFENTTAEVVA